MSFDLAASHILMQATNGAPSSTDSEKSESQPQAGNATPMIAVYYMYSRQTKVRCDASLALAPCKVRISLWG